MISVYSIEIRTGFAGTYSTSIEGWDNVFASRNAAEVYADAARENNGWAARVREESLGFADMTQSQALAALVALDVAWWSEGERAASRRMHAGKSRGLLINSIVYHQMNKFGGVFDAATKKIAKAQLTAADKAELRKGG